MSLIFDDIDEQEAEARRRGLPIEDSKYLPAHLEEEDLDEEEDTTDNNLYDNFYPNDPVEDDAFGEHSPF